MRISNTFSHFAMDAVTCTSIMATSLALPVLAADIVQASDLSSFFKGAVVVSAATFSSAAALYAIPTYMRWSFDKR